MLFSIHSRSNIDIFSFFITKHVLDSLGRPTFALCTEENHVKTFLLEVLLSEDTTEIKPSPVSTSYTADKIL